MQHTHAAAQQITALIYLHAGIGTAVRVSHGARYLHHAEAEKTPGGVDIARTHQHGAHAILPGAQAAVVELILGQRCFEDFVVDFLEELFFAFDVLLGFAFCTAAGFGGGGV